MRIMQSFVRELQQSIWRTKGSARCQAIYGINPRESKEKSFRIWQRRTATRFKKRCIPLANSRARYRNKGCKSFDKKILSFNL